MPASSSNDLLDRSSAAAATGRQNATPAARSGAVEASEVSAVSPASMPLGIPIPMATPSQADQSQNGGAKSRTYRAEASAAKHAEYQKFRAICDEIIAEVIRLDVFVIGDQLDSDAAPHVVEIEDALERLYSCHWGEGDSLKMVVVALQSQLNNIRWERKHVELLKNRVPRLRTAYLLDDRFVDDCYQEIEELGFNEFRGTLSEGALRKRYRIVEETQPE